MALIALSFYATVFSQDIEPARLVALTQTLTAWGSGMLGVIGAYVGYSFGKPPD